MRIFSLYLLFCFALLPGAETNLPELFVQTGHQQQVDQLVLSPDGRYLVSTEIFGDNPKIWDVGTGRQLAALKKQSGIANYWFEGNEKIVRANKEKAEIFSLQGVLLESINLPVVQSYGKPYLTANRKYLLLDEGGFSGVQLIDMSDGAKINLPEATADLSNPLINLGFGYYGFFYDSQRADKNNIGNTAFVIYNEDFQVVKRGFVNGQIFVGGNLKVDKDLKFVFENRYYGDKAVLNKLDLNNGTLLASINSKKTEKFQVLPDSRVVQCIINSERLSVMDIKFDMNLTFYQFLENGSYKEKNMQFPEVGGINFPAISADGQVVCGYKNGEIKLFDRASGREIRQFGVKPVLFMQQVIADGKMLDISKDFHISNNLMDVKLSYNVWNLERAALERFNAFYHTGEVNKNEKGLWFLKDPIAFYRQVPQDFLLDNYQKEYREYIANAVGYPIFFKSSSTDSLNFTKKDNYIAAITKSSKKERAKLYSFSNGEWVIITPEGYFSASAHGAAYINVRIGSQVYSIDNFYEKYYNPEYVASVLTGRIQMVKSDIRAGVALPPKITIVSPTTGSQVTTDQLSIEVAAEDLGGGIEEIRLYHNGKAVGSDTRGLKIVAANDKNRRTFQVTLVDGLNTFRAVGFSRDRTESNPAEVAVRLLAPEKEVSLHVVSVGINQYKNPALNLNYAEPDAKGIADFFNLDSSTLFKKVSVTGIYSENATKAKLAEQFKALTKSNPQDVVVIYLAGHGDNQNGRWYFLPYEVTSPEKEEELKKLAISSDELAEAVKNIKAQKVVLIIDACKSGAALLAFRGFEDRKALSQLSRATGVHIIAASTKDQFASEVKELGHGVFTYMLLEGLAGKAAAKGESVTIRKLMGYIEAELPEISKKYKQEAQYPVVDSQGMDFPISGGGGKK